MKLKALNEPRPIQVQADLDSIPQIVATNGKKRRVEAVRETWRIDDEWWRKTISRLYHTVILEDGAALTVYKDLVGGGWYAQG
jgi:hypothetical protein